MRRRIFFFVIALSILTAIAFFYKYKGESNREVIVLQAGDTQYKKKPLDPGGITMPNSDSFIYDQLKWNSNKTALSDINILPGPEEAIDINFEKEIESIVINSIDEILDNLDYYEENFLVEEGGDQEDNVILPNKVVMQEKNSDKLDISENNQTIDHVTSLKLLKATEDMYKSTKEARDAFADTDGYLVQLAITRTEREARNAWDRINQKNQKILDNSRLVLKKINAKNEKIFFLVLAGPYSSQYKAKLVCRGLKKNKQNCIITK